MSRNGEWCGRIARDERVQQNDATCDLCQVECYNCHQYGLWLEAAE